MNFFGKIFGLCCILSINVTADHTNLLLNNIFSEIITALNAEALPVGSKLRQYPYKPQNHGISLGVYDALRSIAKNDELECISRLLCEAAAGGQPGFSGKQIKFDKLSLTKLMSYLKLDVRSSSPLLVFGKAALLGVSNRGDSYSCIINYPKCPKDQTRLLHYLNNHRGGFFQYFDKQYYKPGTYSYQYQNLPIYNYQKYQKKFKQNKIQFESAGGLYEKLKKKAASDFYATKYIHSTLSFPIESYKDKKPMVFPKKDGLTDPRILTIPQRTPAEDNRFPKRLNHSNFFPQSNNPQRLLAAHATDRLPVRFYFPDNKKLYVNYSTKYSPDSFFPIN